MDALLLLKKAIQSSKQYTDQAIESIAGGLHYKGSVASKENLPLSGNKQGDMYTTNDTGHEWVWTIKESSGTIENWLDLNKELVNYYKKGEVDALLSDLKAELQESIDTKQPKLTAGANITIDENNVISASGGEFDEKTIVKGDDNKYQTAIGGWKETTPEQTTNLFIDTKGNGLPTYMGIEKYEVGWDYNTTITSLVSGATNATVHVKVTVLGTVFDSNMVLTKTQSFPVRWESAEFTIDENIYRIKIYDDYIGENQGGIGLISNKLSLDLSESVMSACGLVTSPASVIYHPIDNKFLKLDDSLDVDDNNALNVNTEVIQPKLTAGTNIIIDANNVISSTGEAKVEYITLSGWDESEGWHDGGTLTDEQAQILVVNELNYIWMNGMHRLDFRYRDNANNLATYASNDGVKSHVIEIKLSDKTWRYSHQMLADKSALETETSERTVADQALNTKIDDLDSSLSSVAKSGNINDIVQTDGDVLILDCNP